MSCPSFVRRFVASLPPGQIFTTRECLIFGKRTNVDKALQKLVKTDYIIRLTRGVFVRAFGIKKLPPILEIAQIKAHAFGKTLRIHGKDTAAQCHLLPDPNHEPTFYVDGSSSSFMYGDQRIHLRKCSKKLMMMTDSKAGLTIRALSVIGRRTVKPWYIEQMAHLWQANRKEQSLVLQSKAWMPAWLGDHFPTTAYLGRTSFWIYDAQQKDRVSCDLDAVYSPFPGSSYAVTARASELAHASFR